jgi:hypothetical protein
MGSDSVNTNKTEFGYGYNPELVGKEGISESTSAEAPGSSTPTTIGDKIVSAGGKKAKVPQFPIPDRDNPQAPIPTLKARQIASVKQSIAEETAKKRSIRGKIGELTSREETGQVRATGEVRAAGEARLAVGQLRGDTASTQGSEDLKNYAAMIMMILLTLADTQSQSRFNQLTLQRDLNALLFQMGMENAQLAAQIKEVAASKEMLMAVKQFVTAGVAIMQTGALIQERGKVTQEMDEKYQNQLEEADQKLTAAQNKATKQKIASENLDDVIKDPQSSPAQIKAAKELKAAEAEKTKIEHKKFEAINLISQ